MTDGKRHLQRPLPHLSCCWSCLSEALRRCILGAVTQVFTCMMEQPMQGLLGCTHLASGGLSAFLGPTIRGWEVFIVVTLPANDTSNLYTQSIQGGLSGCCINVQHSEEGHTILPLNLKVPYSHYDYIIVYSPA